MKILLIENRHTVLMWEPIAKRLLDEGHSVHWLVQNHHFIPKVGEVFKIAYPSANHLAKQWNGNDPDLEFVRSTDRNINYFGGDTSHYSYYWGVIANHLERLRPDLVMGESTLFHEMMCIRQCRRLSIPYLQATSCRYPTGRISFYLYDTTRTFGGSADELQYGQAREIVTRIANRQLKPDYMHKAVGRLEVLRHKLQRLFCSAEVLWGWLRGERFNTPSPVRKWSLQQQLRERRKAWEVLASKKALPSGQFVVCYPMQMQPEANIDVWGNRYRNQTRLIKDLAGQLPADVILAIKPNPKSKYELAPELVDFVASNDRVVAISHRCTMDEIFSSVDLFVTVMGTIGMECIVSAKPVAILGPLLKTKMTEDSFVDDVAGVCRKIAEMKAGTHASCAESARVEYIQTLHEASYVGATGDPTLNPKVLSQSNVLALSQALSHVFELLSSKVELPQKQEVLTSCKASATTAHLSKNAI